MNIFVRLVTTLAGIYLLAPVCNAQDTLWKEDGVSLNLGGWAGVAMNESMESQVNYGSIGLGFHADNYTLGIGYARGNAREDVTDGFYFMARYQAGKNIIDAEYALGKGAYAESQTVANLTNTGFIFEDRKTMTHKAHIGYWRQINSSAFYWGGQCMYLTGDRLYNKGGSASDTKIDQHIDSKELNIGTGISSFVWWSSGLMLSGTMAIGATGARAQHDYVERDTQSNNVITETHENVRTDVGVYISIRASVGWVLGRY